MIGKGGDVKHKLPKSKRRRKQDPYNSASKGQIIAGTWTWSDELITTTFTDAGMGIFEDAGIETGDWIQITGTWDWNSNPIDPKKIHVARRRETKKKQTSINNGIYEVAHTDGTTITVSGGTMIFA